MTERSYYRQDTLQRQSNIVVCGTVTTATAGPAATCRNLNVDYVCARQRLWLWFLLQ